MDNDGNFHTQSISNMQNAVYKGEMSVVDYYERQVCTLFLITYYYYFVLTYYVYTYVQGVPSIC